MAARTTLETLNIFCIIFITFDTTAVQSQECKRILHTSAIDANFRNSVLDCEIDQHHEIRIFKAEYRILKGDDYLLSDDEDLNASCFIKGVTAEIKTKCHQKKQCIFSSEDFQNFENESAATYPYKCDSYKGVRYLMITWQCRAVLNQDYKAYAIDLNDNATHSITFAVVDSHNLWRWFLNYCHPLLNPGCRWTQEQVNDAVLIWNHDKGCNFVVPPNTELWVLAHEFYKIKPKDDPNYNPLPCAQHIQVYNSEQRWILCEMTDFFQVPCQDKEQTFYFKFENQDPRMRVGFAIYFEVDHQAVHMQSTCGIPVSQLPTPPNVDPSSVKTTTTTTTIAPTRTPPPTTTAAPKPKPSSSFQFSDIPTWIVVLLAVVVATIIMLIVISIVCLRHCCKKTGYLEDNQSLDAFGVVSNISTSESWATENPYEEPPSPKPSVLVSSRSKTSSPKTVHFFDDDADDQYMVGGDAKYSSLKTEGYDFF